MKIFFCVFIVWLTCSNLTFGQSRFDKVEIKTIKVADGLYVMMGDGGNMGLSIGQDGVFLIDDQYAPLSPKIIEAIAKLTDKKIHFIFNTHYHDDHTGGNENLGKMNIDIVAHEDVYKRLSHKLQKEGLPIITFNDQLSFHMNGLNIRSKFYAHGHTDSDSVIYFDNKNVIHMGDLFENSGYPYIDLEASGSFIGIINALEDILKNIDNTTIIIPGHGLIANKDDLKTYSDTLKEIYNLLLPLAKNKISIEEVVKLNLLEKYNERWGHGDIRPQTFLKIAYASILNKVNNQ